MSAVLTCLTVNPEEPASEIRAELQERVAELRALAALAKSKAAGGFIDDVDAHVFGAIEALAGQAQLMAETLDRVERPAVPPLNGQRRKVDSLEAGAALTQ